MATATLSQQQASDAERNARIARARKIVRRVLIYSFMSALAFIFLFPIIFMIVAAFKLNERVIADLSSVRVPTDPRTLTTANIQDVFVRVPEAGVQLDLITPVTVIAGLPVNSMRPSCWPGCAVGRADAGHQSCR